MGVIEGVAFLLLCVPVSLFIVTVYTLSAVGKWLGFRRKYIQCLLYIFEYGKKRIERAHRLKRQDRQDSIDESEIILPSSDSNDDEDVDDGISTASESEYLDTMGRSIGSSPPCRHHVSHIGLGQISDECKLESENAAPSWDGASTGTGDGSMGQEEEENMILDKDDNADFELSDIFEFIHSGIEAIVEDQVTQRFASEELKSWNLLTRTNRVYEFISWRLSFIWLVGFCVRYGILLPFRVTICFLGCVFLTMSTALVGCIPQSYHGLKQKLYKIVYLHAFEFLSWSLSAVISHHHRENRPGVAKRTLEGKAISRGGGICVANHTSPIDVLVLAVDQCYDMVGQTHGGLLGILQRALARASSHIWFERSEMKDREAVARRLKEHVDDARKLPILIFPEGTCINNSAVMQFKKGSFEVEGVIYPVAIKYDARFGDPFWDSSSYSMVQYLLMMMSSWAIVCDVWYLPPMFRKKGESAVEFASRVKAVIARKGGLVDLDWDGALKRAFAKKEWKEQQQLAYSKKFVSSPKKSAPIFPPSSDGGDMDIITTSPPSLHLEDDDLDKILLLNNTTTTPHHLDIDDLNVNLFSVNNRLKQRANLKSVDNT
ncbi:glycerol-3-phosphate acyltransferase 3 [Folsomia candida]|uniref:Glycerol-3-phosphate acyltransferase 3 n=1 Tax=Folsomia candida TaxID=158441 RepID=A0A226D1A4_FOLCA|nr:glycerol-3-phosphate acyltransferase 3 [Folsomia candida]XP_035700878.1 glycerol-3-phosphate acyltransferase 3 [Folsomia candida]OXA38487.1 Glycerol-3-phosphate acyltransferase 3 [Folsomia candida]